MPPTKRARPAVQTHMSPGIVFAQYMLLTAVGILAVVSLIIHLAAGRDPRWGWTAVVLLLTAGLLGATMFLPWWLRGRKGLYGDNDPAGFYPAEDHLRMRTVQTHGVLADLTWVLLIIALLVT